MRAQSYENSYSTSKTLPLNQTDQIFSVYWRVSAAGYVDFLPSTSGFQTLAHIRITCRAWKNRLLGPPTEFLMQSVWNFAFLTNSKVILMLLLWGPHFGNHGKLSSMADFLNQVFKDFPKCNGLSPCVE